MINRPIRVLIVDDSALVRKRLLDTLASDPAIEVVGTAADPYIARDKILSLKPDVLTLDIEMPRMDGLTFLRVLMKHHPIPVIIISSLTTEGSPKIMEALQAGAVDVLAKPNGTFSICEDGLLLAEKIKAAAQAKLKNLSHPPAPVRPALSAVLTPASLAPTGLAPAGQARGGYAGRGFPARQIIVMGASTGGTEALKAVLTRLPADLPAMCIVQHIPQYFSEAFANRLNELCSFEVREAKAGDVLRPGLALIAPGGQHVVLKRQANHFCVELNAGPPVHHQRPAVDVLFDSVVKTGAGAQALAVLLTGMGSDGAAGMLKLREAGAVTIAQNEETCVVFGMPREAIRLGAVQYTLPLPAIPACIERCCLHPAHSQVPT
jgi:two-component system chemotaxis response regulator CheB